MSSIQADTRCLPACLCQPAGFERCGPVLAGVDAMMIETGLSEVWLLRSVPEMAAALLR